MKFTIMPGLAALIAISACGRGTSEPENTAATSPPVIAENMTSAPENTCSEYSSDYRISYAFGETALPEGQQEALDTGFEKLLPIVSECGNFHVTLVTTTADSEENALERAAIIQEIFNESYYVPLNLIAVETTEPDVMNTSASDDPLETLKPEVIIELRVRNTAE